MKWNRSAPLRLNLYFYRAQKITCLLGKDFGKAKSAKLIVKNLYHLKLKVNYNKKHANYDNFIRTT